MIFSFVINLVNVAQTEASNGRLKTKLGAYRMNKSGVAAALFCAIAGTTQFASGILLVQALSAKRGVLGLRAF